MKDIDPIHALAMSMQARPKLYAFLLGSGVSRAANIPTGWEVVLDLVQRLAALSDEEPSDFHQWYVDKYGTEPNYSELLEQLARTPADRQQLQRRYWDADGADGGARQPTEAHRAIADLVKGGFVKIIVTTNFDRLIENALRDAGVEPMVLSSEDDILGMIPLDHTDCCVVKLHGDYMDQRIRNTGEELAEYPRATAKLLERILDEYGLVVCGWSGEWDVALGRAIRRAQSRRYTAYWAAHGSLGDAAERMVKLRDARIIEIESADRFFGQLSELVRSLRNTQTPHPLSVEATVAQCKRFLAHDHHRIDLADLIDAIGIEALSDLADLPQLESVDGETLAERMRRCEDICSKLLTVATTASYWSDVSQVDAWRNTVMRFFGDVRNTGTEVDILLSTYPVILLIYALSIGAVGHGRLDCLGRIMGFPTGRDLERLRGQMAAGREEEVAEGLGDAVENVARADKHMQSLPGMERRYVPMSDWLYQSLRSHTTTLIPTEKRYERFFDRTEVLLSLGIGLRENGRRVGSEFHWFRVGRFLYRNSTFPDIVKDVETSLERDGNDSLFVQHKLVGNRADDALDNLKSFREFVAESRRRRGILLR